MNGINLKGFEVRSFMTRGLTAKWGIGENRVPPTYAEDFTSSKWKFFSDRATATVTKSEVHVTEIIRVSQFIETPPKTYANKTVVRVSGISGTGKTLYYRYGNPRQALKITDDGVYTLPQGVYNEAIDGYNGFQIAPVGVCDITIVQLPV